MNLIYYHSNCTNEVQQFTEACETVLSEEQGLMVLITLKVKILKMTTDISI